MLDDQFKVFCFFVVQKGNFNIVHIQYSYTYTEHLLMVFFTILILVVLIKTWLLLNDDILIVFNFFRQYKITKTDYLNEQ